MTEPTTDPAAVVASLEAAWAAKDVDAIVSHFADDAIYHNIPMDPAVGVDAIREVITGFVGMADSIVFETRNQVVDGGMVMNERVDTFVIAGNPVAIPVMGVFEIEDGRIRAWRDYFDMAGFSGG